MIFQFPSSPNYSLILWFKISERKKRLKRTDASIPHSLVVLTPQYLAEALMPGAAFVIQEGEICVLLSFQASQDQEGECQRLSAHWWAPQRAWPTAHRAGRSSVIPPEPSQTCQRALTDNQQDGVQMSAMKPQLNSGSACFLHEFCPEMWSLSLSLGLIYVCILFCICSCRYSHSLR